MSNNVKPGWWLYSVAALIIIIGIGAFIGILWVNISDISNSLQQVVVPGSKEVFFEKPGKCTIFYEYESIIDDKIYRTNSEIWGLKCAVFDKTTNTYLKVTQPSSNSNYTFGGRQGKSVLEFNIDKAGTYILEANYEEGKRGAEIVLAVGQGFFGKILKTVFISIIILFGSLGLSILIIIITYEKREKFKKLYQQSTIKSEKN